MPRPTEENGTHYHFTTAARFQQLREKNAFVEYAKFAGFEYGTSHDAVREVQRRGRVCVLDIDLEVGYPVWGEGGGC